MNIQMKRLYEAAKILRNVEGQSDVARIMNASPQTVNNWEARGISNEGLLTAQEAIGCDAIWLRDGTGNMSKGGVAKTSDLSDVAHLITSYGKLDAQERQMVLAFMRDILNDASGSGTGESAENNA
jgi:DNA-binding XRE family transcriptional regulator